MADEPSLATNWWRWMRVVILAGAPVGMLVGGVGSRLAFVAVSALFGVAIGPAVEMIERRAVPAGWRRVRGLASARAARPTRSHRRYPGNKPVRVNAAFRSRVDVGRASSTVRATTRKTSSSSWQPS